MAESTADTTWSMHAKSLCNSPSAAGLLLMMAVSIFFVELLVMTVIHELPFTVEPEGFVEGLLDSLLLILLLSPMLYYFLFRPLLLHITERKLAEEGLRRERNKLKGILDVMPDGVCTVGKDYTIQYVNPMLERQFGPRNGHKCYEYFHGRIAVCPWCKNEDVFAGKPVRWEMRAEKTGRTYELFDTPVANDDGSVLKLEFVHDITDRVKSEQALRESELQLRRLSAQLISAQEQERRRISRELHDELGQALTLMKLQLRSIEERLRPDQGDLRGECDHTLRYLDQVIDDVRRLSRDLSPAVLEHQGLTAALRGLLANFAKPLGIEAVFDDGGVDLDGLFPRDDRTLLYRIVQEALTNVGKHAGARNVSVVVTRRDRVVSLLIADDGRGFDVKRETAKASAERGLGLYAMEERARMLGGLLEVWSEEGGGAGIAVSVPGERRASSHEALSHSTG